MARQEKKLNKNSSLVFSLPSTPTLHCVSELCIKQTSPIGSYTCSTIKSNSLLAATRQLLIDNIPS